MNRSTRSIIIAAVTTVALVCTACDDIEMDNGAAASTAETTSSISSTDAPEATDTAETTAEETGVEETTPDATEPTDTVETTAEDSAEETTSEVALTEQPEQFDPWSQTVTTEPSSDDPDAVTDHHFSGIPNLKVTSIPVTMNCNMQTDLIPLYGNQVNGVLDGDQFFLNYSIDVWAPETVKPGEDFYYIVEPGFVGVPTGVSGTVNETENLAVTFTEFDQAAYRINIPRAGVNRVSYFDEYATPGAWLHLNNGQYYFAGETDTFGYTTSNKSRWKKGGWTGSSILGETGVKVPGISFHMRGGKAGTEMTGPSLSMVDPNLFSPDAHFSFRAKADVKYKWLATMHPQAIARCTPKNDVVFPTVKVVAPETSTAAATTSEETTVAASSEQTSTTVQASTSEVVSTSSPAPVVVPETEVSSSEPPASTTSEQSLPTPVSEHPAEPAPESTPPVVSEKPAVPTESEVIVTPPVTTVEPEAPRVTPTDTPVVETTPTTASEPSEPTPTPTSASTSASTSSSTTVEPTETDEPEPVEPSRPSLDQPFITGPIEIVSTESPESQVTETPDDEPVDATVEPSPTTSAVMEVTETTKETQESKVVDPTDAPVSETTEPTFADDSEPTPTVIFKDPVVKTTTVTPDAVDEPSSGLSWLWTLIGALGLTGILGLIWAVATDLIRF